MRHNLLAAAGALFVATVATYAQTQPPSDIVKQAQTLESEGKRSEALTLYKQAAAKEPTRFEPHLGIGRILDLDGKYAEARQHLQKAVELAPDASQNQVLTAIAISFAFEGKAADAAKYFQKVFERQRQAGSMDGAAGTANGLGRVYLETGDVANAEKWYRTGYETAQKIDKLEPADKDLWEMRWAHAQARIAARRKQFDEARTQVEAVRTIMSRGTIGEGQRANLPYVAGYVAFYEGKYDAAIDELSKGDQEDPFVLGLLAQAYERKKEPAKARGFYEKILEGSDHTLQAAFARPLAQRGVAGR
jgi:tetratricopeptide (TPR) repeat protein